MNSYVFVPFPTLATSSSGTESGYSDVDMSTPDQHTFWRTDVGGTVEVVWNGYSSSTAMKGVLITSPNGLGIQGDVTIRFYDGITLLDTIIAPRYVADGLADRRVVFIENEIWKDDITRMELDFDANSEVSYIALLIELADGLAALELGLGMFRNITPYLNTGWEISFNSLGKSSNGTFAYFYAEDDNLMNYRIFKGVLSPVVESSYKWKRFYLEKTNHPHMFMAVYVAQHDDSAELQTLMMQNSIYGRLSGDYNAQFVGKNDDAEFMYSIQLNMQEMV